MIKESLRRILVAVDGSPGSEKAVAYGIDLAKKSNAELLLVHVIDEIKMGGVIGARAKYGDVKLIEGYDRVRKEHATRWLKPLEEQARSEKVKVSSDILYDDGKSITGMLVEYAEKNDVDLIAVGTRGLSRFKRLLVGSVASGLSSHAPCPVLIAR
jgi:nucleotide-binding universal stress UspA family protein